MSDYLSLHIFNFKEAKQQKNKHERYQNEQSC